mmetsp:Transcript_47192/g.111275  ORF Transcript_47192/g.111275 Transcript_47192/m.111275 type:complete len:243 (-) Transcript_47192:143-871(-)
MDPSRRHLLAVPAPRSEKLDHDRGSLEEGGEGGGVLDRHHPARPSRRRQGRSWGSLELDACFLLWVRLDRLLKEIIHVVQPAQALVRHDPDLVSICKQHLHLWEPLDPKLPAQRFPRLCRAVQLADLGCFPLLRRQVGELDPGWRHRLAVSAPRGKELDEERPFLEERVQAARALDRLHIARTRGGRWRHFPQLQLHLVLCRIRLVGILEEREHLIHRPRPRELDVPDAVSIRKQHLHLGKA